MGQRRSDVAVKDVQIEHNKECEDAKGEPGGVCLEHGAKVIRCSSIKCARQARNGSVCRAWSKDQSKMMQQ